MSALVKNVKNTFKGYYFYVVEGPFRNSVVTLIKYGSGTICETLGLRLRQDTIIISRGIRDVPSDIMRFEVLGIDFITDCLDKGFMIHPKGYILRQGYESSEYTPIFASNFKKWYTKFLAEGSEQNHAHAQHDGNANNPRIEPEDCEDPRNMQNGNTINNFDEVPSTLNQQTSVAEDHEGESTNKSSNDLEVIYISSDSDDEEFISTKQVSVVDDIEEKPVQLNKPPAFINPNKGSKTQCAPQKKDALSTALQSTRTHVTKSKPTDDIIVSSPKRIIRATVVAESASKVAQDGSATNSKDVSPRSRRKVTEGTKSKTDINVSSPKRMTRATVVESASKVVQDRSSTNSKDVLPKSRRKVTEGTKSKPTDDNVSSPKRITRAAVVESASKVDRDGSSTNSKDVLPRTRRKVTEGTKSKPTDDIVSSPKRITRAAVVESASKVVQDGSATNSKDDLPRSRRKVTEGTKSKPTDDIVSCPKRITRAAVVESASKVDRDGSATNSKDVLPKSRSKVTNGTKDKISGNMDVTTPEGMTRTAVLESASKVVRDRSTTDSKDVTTRSKRKETQVPKSKDECQPQKKTRTTLKSGPEETRNKSPSLDSRSSTRPPGGDTDDRGEKTGGIVMSRSPGPGLPETEQIVPASEGSQLTSITHLPVAPAENDEEGWLPKPNTIDVVKLDDFRMPLVSLKEPKLDTGFASDFDLVSALCPKCKQHTVYSQLNPLYVGSNGPGHCLGCAQQGINIEMKLAFRLVMEVGDRNRRLEVNVIGRSGRQLFGCNEDQFLQDQSVRQRVLDTLRAAVSNEAYIQATTIVTNQKDYHCIFLTNPKFLRIGSD